MSFKESLKVGKIGEALAYELLNSMPKVKHIVDVREDESFQDKDVDFLLEMIDKKISWVEVKTDTMAYRTGNIAYEETSSGNAGCLKRSWANMVMYYVCDEQSYKGTMYCINMSALRMYVDRFCKEPRRMGDASTGYLIPIQDLIDKRVIAKEWNYE